MEIRLHNVTEKLVSLHIVKGIIQTEGKTKFVLDWEIPDEFASKKGLLFSLAPKDENGKFVKCILAVPPKEEGKGEIFIDGEPPVLLDFSDIQLAYLR